MLGESTSTTQSSWWLPTYLAPTSPTPSPPQGRGGKSGENRDTDDRILIKGMRGAEVDLVVAGVVDSMGNLFVQGDSGQ